MITETGMVTYTPYETLKRMPMLEFFEYRGMVAETLEAMHKRR